MKLSNEEILKKIEEIEESENVNDGWRIRDLISSLNLTPEQMELLSDHENEWVRWELAQNPKITKELMIKLSSDERGGIYYEAFKKLENLNSLKSNDLESAYDLINNSKYIRKKSFEKTFDFIINKFPELSELTKMFKRIILKGKKDLK